MQCLTACQIAFGKYFDDSWFTLPFVSRSTLIMIGTTLSDEDVSIWSISRNRGSRKPLGVHVDPKNRRNPKLSVRCPLNHAGQVNCQNMS